MPSLTLTDAEMAQLLAQLIIRNTAQFKTWLRELKVEELARLNDAEINDCLTDTLTRMVGALSLGRLM